MEICHERSLRCSGLRIVEVFAADAGASPASGGLAGRWRNSIIEVRAWCPSHTPVKTLLIMMRYFHYMIGITAPSKEQEKVILLVWIGVALGLLAICVLFMVFAVPHILQH